VKISGDIIAATEPYADVDDTLNAGKVYIYDTDGDLISTLQSPKPGNTYNFGLTVDIFDNTVVTCEPKADIDDLKFAGKTHVFSVDGTHQLTLRSPEPRAGGYFGNSGIYEDLMLFEENIEEGVVHMFDNEGSYLRSLASPNPIVLGKFGRTIEVGETLILIREAGSTDWPGGVKGPGSVHVFNHDGDFVMTLQAPEPQDQALFGSSISISGNLIVIGESCATVNDVFRAGRVYIFNTDGEHLQTLQSPTLKLNGRFGDSVAIDGDRLVVGEWGANVNPFQYEGRAYVYDVEGNLLQNLTAVPPSPRGAFGLDVDIMGDFIVVGESWAALDDFGQAGRVHVFKLGAPLETQEPVVVTTIETEDEIETEDNDWIPGYPLLSIGVALLLVSIIISRTQKQ
jgi:hypothetical protein